MNSKERILAAFEGRETDKIPTYQAGFSSYVASAVLGREAYVGGGIQQWREAKALWEGEEAHQEYLERSRRDALEIPKVLDLDLVRTSYWRMAEKPAKKIDEHTFMYGDPDQAWQVRHFDPETELYQLMDWHPKKEFTFEDLERQVRAGEEALEARPPRPSKPSEEIMEALRIYGEERIVLGGGLGLSIPTRSEQQSHLWLEAIALKPELVARHLNVQTERAIPNVEGQAKLGLRLLVGGGDFASNKGPFYSPKAFHELMLPCLQRYSAVCRDHGMLYSYASDGNLWPVAEDLFEKSGIDGYHEIDRRAGMDLGKLKERFPHLTLLGNISSHTVHVGTKEAVIRETLSCLEAAKQYGGIIVGCSNYPVPQTPMENFWAMIETIQKYR